MAMGRRRQRAAAGVVRGEQRERPNLAGHVSAARRRFETDPDSGRRLNLRFVMRNGAGSAPRRGFQGLASARTSRGMSAPPPVEPGTF